MNWIILISLIIFNAIVITFSIILAIVKELKWLYWIAFLTPVLTITIYAIVYLILFLSKKEDTEIDKSKLKQEKPKIKDPTLRTFAIQIIKEIHGEEMPDINYQRLHVGQEGEEKTDIFTLYGWGYHTNKLIYILINTETLSYTVISGNSYEEMIANNKLNDAINKLAENPATMDITERTVSIDPVTGLPTQNIRTIKQTKKQIRQQREEEKEREESTLGE